MTTLVDRIPPGRPIKYQLITQIVTCSCGHKAQVSKLWKDMRRPGKDPIREQVAGTEELFTNIPWAEPGITHSLTARCDQCIDRRMSQLIPLTLLPQGTVKLTPSWAAIERKKLEAATRVVSPKREPKIAAPVAHPSDFS